MKLPILFIIPALLALPGHCLAHPETGFLPDAIAETEYRIVLEINPKDVQTRNRLGIVLYRKNKLKEAEREFMEVLQTVGRDFDAHDGMGLVKLKEKKYGDAVAWFQRAIAINSEDTMVYHSLGLALEQLGRLKEAESAYRKGLEVNARQLRGRGSRDAETGKKDVLVTALKNLLERMKSGRGGV